MSSAGVLERSDQPAGATDHQLVSAARLGNDRAFEQLYSRYQRRIAAYVYGMVKDYGRAEDITQEVFLSALRRMRETERPIAFKPWIYEIAKNACIDAHRRGRRAEEVSFDADDRLSPSDHGRLVAVGPSPDAAVDAKQDLDNLCGAFGGLSESHHQILVMRELEGLSYKQIGERMGMSRPAVESTLFRARKRLGEEYDELASGARCLRIQAIIADAGGARVGLRDQRKLTRHLSHCQPCRQVAVLAGLDVAVTRRRRVAEKIASWLPLPAFLRLRRGDGERFSPGGGGWMAHAPSFAEPLSSGWSKAAAGLAALAVAGAGVGVGTSAGDKRDERGTGFRPSVERTAGGAGGKAAVTPAPARKSGDAATARQGGARTGTQRAGAAGRGTQAPGQPPAARDGSKPAAGGGGGNGGGSGGGGGGNGTPRTPSLPGANDLPAVKTPNVPKIDVPAVRTPNLPRSDVPVVGGGRPVQDAVDGVNDTVDKVRDTVNDTVDKVQPIVPDPPTVVPNVGQTVDDLGDAVDDLSDTAGGLLNP